VAIEDGPAHGGLEGPVGTRVPPVGDGVAVAAAHVEAGTILLVSDLESVGAGTNAMPCGAQVGPELGGEVEGALERGELLLVAPVARSELEGGARRDAQGVAELGEADAGVAAGVDEIQLGLGHVLVRLVDIHLGGSALADAYPHIVEVGLGGLEPNLGHTLELLVGEDGEVVDDDRLDEALDGVLVGELGGGEGRLRLLDALAPAGAVEGHIQGGVPLEPDVGSAAPAHRAAEQGVGDARAGSDGGGEVEQRIVGGLLPVHARSGGLDVLEAGEDGGVVLEGDGDAVLQREHRRLARGVGGRRLLLRPSGGREETQGTCPGQQPAQRSTHGVSPPRD